MTDTRDCGISFAIRQAIAGVEPRSFSPAMISVGQSILPSLPSNFAIAGGENLVSLEKRSIVVPQHSVMQFLNLLRLPGDKCGREPSFECRWVNGLRSLPLGLLQPLPNAGPFRFRPFVDGADQDKPFDRRSATDGEIQRDQPSERKSGKHCLFQAKRCPHAFELRHEIFKVGCPCQFRTLSMS